MRRTSTSLNPHGLFEQVPMKNGVPESVLKKITPEMSRYAETPPLVPPHMAKIDLACGRVTQTILMLPGKRRLMREDSPAAWVSSALEAKGAHLGLGWAELGSILGQNPEMVKGKANIKNACKRVSTAWENSHGVTVRWDFEGRFRVAKDNERERFANWFMRFLVGTYKNARVQVWGKLPDPERQLVQEIPIFGELESGTHGQSTY